MSICAHRTDEPASFTSCEAALDGSPCACGVEVRAAMAPGATEMGIRATNSADRSEGYTDGISGSQGREREIA